MQGVGSGYPVGLTDKAANNLGKVRYQLKKAQGPTLDSATVIHEFESIADEIDQADAIASGECGGATLVETTSEKYRRLWTTLSKISRHGRWHQICHSNDTVNGTDSSLSSLHAGRCHL